MITFISPFPRAQGASDGYLSRVMDIDKIFTHLDRTYIEVKLDSSLNIENFNFEQQGNLKLVTINWHSAAGRSKLDEILSTTDSIYCHSIYQARYILGHFRLKPVILDFHGVVPEENLLYQDSSLFAEMNEIEAYAYRFANSIVVVSESMKDHFQKKYPDLMKETIHLPVAAPNEKHSDLNRIDKILKLKQENLLLYSGGTQKWQNLDKIYSFIQSSPPDYRFIFLSPDYKNIRLKLKELGIIQKCEIHYSSKMTDLLSYYERAKFGFILRDDNVVNRVASPTKVFEYLNFGIIPVVDSPKIGDFYKLGYHHLCLNDFHENKLSEQDLLNKARENKSVVAKFVKQYSLGRQELQNLVLGMPESQAVNGFQVPIPKSLFNECFSVSPVYKSNRVDESHRRRFLINRGRYVIDFPLKHLPLNDLVGFD
ncbi:MAG: hypothetical protein IPK04_06610 [Bdellovibrionales bacterium]|nr:hypothetical protein [Bdellovibrionales bacterium]